MCHVYGSKIVLLTKFHELSTLTACNDYYMIRVEKLKSLDFLWILLIRGKAESVIFHFYTELCYLLYMLMPSKVHAIRPSAFEAEIALIYCSFRFSASVLLFMKTMYTSRHCWGSHIQWPNNKLRCSQMVIFSVIIKKSQKQLWFQSPYVTSLAVWSFILLPFLCIDKEILNLGNNSKMQIVY